MSAQTKLIKKITIKGIASDAISGAKKGKVELATIYGVLADSKPIETNFGTCIKFLGEFEAMNSAGETFVSNSMFLPDLAANLLESALHPASGDAPNSVDFAITIGAEPADTPAGYQYTITPVLEFKPSDPVQRLRALVGSKQQTEKLLTTSAEQDVPQQKPTEKKPSHKK